MPTSSTRPETAIPAPRPSLWFLFALLIAWNAYSAYRLTQPMKVGHEAFIGRQIGRSGLNHLALGLAVTKGANTSVLRQNGALVIHRSYTPLASWTVALPMALGLNFDLSVRLPVLVSSNLFLIGLWSFVVARWGVRQADLAALFAAFSPIFLFRYGLACIFEILALGPLMIGVALFARPRRDAARCVLIAVVSVAAVMYSWICWLVLVPALVRDWRLGHRTAALAVGSAVLFLPVAVHFLLTALASGDIREDVWYFFYHILQRSSAEGNPGRPLVTYPEIIQILLKRWYRGVGLIPIMFVASGVIAVAARRRVAGLGWLVAFFVMALPLNLARNIAFKHDFFILLFVPVSAIAAGVGTWWLAERFDRSIRKAAVIATILTLYIGFEVAPKYRIGSVFAKDYEQAAIADSIGEFVHVGDFVIVSPEFCGLTSTTAALLHDLEREQSPRPFYCGRMTQTVFVASDPADAERLARWARPGQRVVFLKVGEAPFEMPASFTRIPSLAKRLVMGVRQAEVAGLPGPTLR